MEELEAWEDGHRLIILLVTCTTKLNACWYIRGCHNYIVLTAQDDYSSTKELLNHVVVLV